ncbi:hypothetical protein [uncultured Prevotella sp.]|uniref:hypothetical protein n=1 Tax=uncultured Prevotella sp. TaxID=159272 RepID=UPI0027E2B6B3|nr:hypothetical protein [uncultured Prevotella sp.]
MGIFLLKQCSASILFECMVGLIGIGFFIVCLIWLLREFFRTWREKKAKQKEGCQQQEKRIWLPEPLVILTPKEHREYMLNHIEDGRFYTISSPRSFYIAIVCAKRYDAEEKMLYCYAYLWISERSVYNLHVSDHRGILKLRDFLGDNHLRIDFDRNPNLIFFGEEIISPYLTQRDYNDFVLSMQKAGVECNIEKGEDNGLGSYKYRLKEIEK